MIRQKLQSVDPFLPQLAGGVLFACLCAFTNAQPQSPLPPDPVAGIPAFARPTSRLSFYEVDTLTSGPSRAMPFGRFLPETMQERRLEMMLDGPDSGIRLDQASFLIASDLPAFRGMSQEQFDRMLDGATSKVAKSIHAIAEDPKYSNRRPSPKNRVFDFCQSIIDLGTDYRDEFKSTELSLAQSRALYGDERNIFLPGLLSTGRGCCVSMPMLYLCIGRNLGYPVHLVSIGKHSFVRWEEPGLRLNIETTIVAHPAITDSEANFLEMEGIARKDVKSGELRNLTNREIVGALFHARAGCFIAHGPQHYDAAYRDLRIAAHLAPENYLVQKSLEHVRQKLAAVYAQQEGQGE